MNPPFFQVINVPAVRAVFGTNPTRVWPFGDAPDENPPRQVYAVFQTISGNPEQYINQVPDSDDWLVQVDVYVESATGRSDEAIDLVTNGARVLRDAIEPVAYITAWRTATREPGTRLYRYGFDVAFVTSR